MNTDPFFIGRGIFTWDGEERRTLRYGYVTIHGADYLEKVQTSSLLEVGLISDFVGQQMTLTVKIIETRQSGHVGDHFLKIYPSSPKVEEIIVLGTGTLSIKSTSFGIGYAIGLVPKDGREDFWIDPRILYRLHDQTVEIFMTPTAKPDHEKPDIQLYYPNGVISNGDDTIQVCTKEPLNNFIRVNPKIDNLVNGLFVVLGHNHPDATGQWFELDTEGD